jgi:multimeric flavodoxin WrbA
MMKVLLINGSPEANGCTWRALKEIADTLEAEGVEAEIAQIGKKKVGGCIGCGGCARNNHRCVFKDDVVNEILDKVDTADGMIVGSPVYFGSPNGSLISLMDRMYMAGINYKFKPAAAICSARRAGTTSTIDVINKYFLMADQPIVPSNYMNMVHGATAADVEKDEEGLQTMRILGRNMAYMLKCFEAGRKAGLKEPELEEKVKTSYIR